MRGIKLKLSISKLSILGCTVVMRKRDRDVSKLEPKALEGNLWVTPKETTDTWCTYATHAWLWQFEMWSSRSPNGLNPWQHTYAQPTRWVVTATGDLAPRWWSSRRWQQRGAGHIYCKKGKVAWRREREHSRNDTETRCLRCWGSSTGWRIYCNKRESQRLWVTGRQWNGGLLKDSCFFEEAMEQADRAEPRRASNVLQIVGEVRTHLAATEGNYLEPKTVYEAKQADEWDQWYRAMNDEVKTLQDNETWDLVRPPTDRDVILGKWVYKVKLGPSGQVDKYRERNVAKGFKQVEGLEYFEAFEPTCKPETFRILLQLSTKQGHVMHQFDVKTAFLHSPIEEEVYLEQPQEFLKPGSVRG